MRKAIENKPLLHLTDYGAPYAGNFIASLGALEHLLGENCARTVYVLPARAADRVWAQEMAQAHTVRFLEKGGFFSCLRQVR